MPYAAGGVNPHAARVKRRSRLCRIILQRSTAGWSAQVILSWQLSVEPASASKWKRQRERSGDHVGICTQYSPTHGSLYICVRHIFFPKMPTNYHRLNSPTTVRRVFGEVSRGKKLLAGLLLLALAAFCLYGWNWPGGAISGSAANISDAAIHAPTSPVTVVTAYYRIPSKQAESVYLQWMRNFLPHIPCFLYIFTDAASAPRLRTLRAPHANRTRLVVRELPALHEYAKMDAWRRLQQTDPETYHTPELYLLWNEKPWFVQWAIRDNAFRSQYFLWCDIGSFRAPEQLPALRAFPDPGVVAARLPDPAKLALLLLRPFDAATEYVDARGFPSAVLQRAGTNHIGGGIMAGTPAAWQVWIGLYEAMQTLYLQRGLNAGKDQNVMNAVALRYPHHVQLVSPRPYLGGRGNPWFYLQYYFAVLD
ncbi:uncharacterized protein LOC129593147 isoform X2 [Paramacrobiotus metropolitanus]|uniref:uncharacterized protein LOC129593147 isoform X2 n=1 Tax=Paramacrobiotus metropolitanus TaxID=2943436 RepID=UPI0024457944|nr:uncharacterized protein LOC129593147 isoform X2 [Paramacrobiotus metropolitanus]